MNIPETQTSTSEQEYYSSGTLIAIVGAFLIMTIFGATRSSFGVFFKPITNEFGWTRALTSGAYSLAWIMHGLSSIFDGRLTDKYGSGKVLLVLALFMGTGHILMSQIGEVWQMYLVYGVVIGIGSAVHVPIFTYVARRFKNRASLMTGLVMAGSGAGQMIGPLATTWLIETYTWQMSYIVLGVIAIVIVMLSSLALGKPALKTETVISSNTDTIESPVVNEPVGFSLKAAMRTWKFWVALLMFFCISFCGQSVVVHLVPYITDHGIDTTTAASILSLTGVLMMVSRVVTGHMADRIGNDVTFMIGFGILGLALFMLLFPVNLIILYLFALIFGFAWSISILGSPLIAKIFGLGALGAILGVLNLGNTLGCACGPFVFGYIHDLTDSYHYAFILSIALAAIGFILAAGLTRNRKMQRERETGRRA